MTAAHRRGQGNMETNKSMCTVWQPSLPLSDGRNTRSPSLPVRRESLEGWGGAEEGAEGEVFVSRPWCVTSIQHTAQGFFSPSLRLPIPSCLPQPPSFVSLLSSSPLLHLNLLHLSSSLPTHTASTGSCFTLRLNQKAKERNILSTCLHTRTHTRTCVCLWTHTQTHTHRDQGTVWEWTKGPRSNPCL